MKKIFAVLMSTMLVFTGLCPAFADSADTYVALGADLTQDQRATVLESLEMTESDLANVDTITITNAMEYEYLGSYLPASVIGTRALSCVRVDKTQDGGINVRTVNISYCTEGMYQNALITAGVENADVIVAGPFSISGTAGLVGAMQAYQGITGEAIDEESADAAVEELVTTGDLAESVGSKDAENLVAIVKQEVIESDGASEDEILKMIDDAASELGITLTDEERQALLSLMKKIAALDIDPDKLKSQAKDLYDRIQSLGIDFSKLGIDFDGIDKNSLFSAIEKFFDGIVSYFKKLFSA